MKKEILFLFLILFLISDVYASDCNPKNSVNLSDLDKLYVNNSLNSPIELLTKCHLDFLGDGIFSGNVFALYNQTIKIGSQPKIIQNNSKFFITNSQTTYNYTIHFSKTVNFSHLKSKEENIKLLGKDFFISSETGGFTSTYAQTIVLLEGKKIEIDDKNKKIVQIKDKTYTIELISASDNSAVIRLTDNEGNKNVKEISEKNLEFINDLFIEVVSADETFTKSSAVLIIVSEINTLIDGMPVLLGIEDKFIENTLVDFGTGNPNNITSITISYSNKNLIKEGETFIDPVFKKINLNFKGTAQDIKNKTYMNILFENIVENCTPQWILGDWSFCQNGLRFKDWIDINNCKDDSTKPQKINVSCSTDEDNVSIRIENLEQRITALEEWKSLVSLWIDSTAIQINEFISLTNEMKLKNKIQDSNITFLQESLSEGILKNYFKYLSNSDKEKMLCGYATENRLTSYSDLNMSCSIEYKQLRNGRERISCKCE